jgi:succinyl-diaminopimelate desuccinylase
VQDAIKLTQELIKCKSITPVDAGVMAVLVRHLESIDFICHLVEFNDAPGEPTQNLYARFGNKQPNLCFAGHVDVVPEGDLAKWSVPPFEAVIKDGYLIGRGAEDMKGAIAAFVVAAAEFIKKNTNFDGSISFLITGDEEGISINGTKKMLPWLKEKGEVIDGCIVGEPTNPTILGQMAKIGRRGSAYGNLTITGKQGHVAYPELADNPVTTIIAMLDKLKNTQIDEGSEFFPPSNLEITTIDVANKAGNVIPMQANAKFNIRFNDKHNATTIETWVKTQLDSVGKEYHLDWRVSGESFLTKPGKLSAVIVDACKEITGLIPELSTTGGTSDARFIKDICPVVEFGTTGSTAHAVDEKVKTDDIIKLKDIYLRVLEKFFI